MEHTKTRSRINDKRHDFKGQGRKVTCVRPEVQTPDPQTPNLAGRLPTPGNNRVHLFQGHQAD